MTRQQTNPNQFYSSAVAKGSWDDVERIDEIMYMELVLAHHALPACQWYEKIVEGSGGENGYPRIPQDPLRILEVPQRQERQRYSNPNLLV